MVALFLSRELYRVAIACLLLGTALAVSGQIALALVDVRIAVRVIAVLAVLAAIVWIAQMLPTRARMNVGALVVLISCLAINGAAQDWWLGWRAQWVILQMVATFACVELAWNSVNMLARIVAGIMAAACLAAMIMLAIVPTVAVEGWATMQLDPWARETITRAPTESLGALLAVGVLIAGAILLGRPRHA